mmetsp:Transcript_1125/g.1728  ORF Transcript_1125/g.1728 Transcript_1125/m.1728 type:complete len:245 (+) Transcript_1125:31-765(+)|eukprot:CAMPEP_0171464400 /NCGR_PEP_ID=MMETSP0945-20130129/7737_1 /TAXON_ID=109269 /ORGANISM="Vaucheria litorea, Strain CCMP2940" /LENGTH=244 /DNA_ID=CAMNT_0011991487 /DNA_START=31 /DNA_END=765 /DNA_ORIENTATION=-
MGVFQVQSPSQCLLDEILVQVFPMDISRQLLLPISIGDFQLGCRINNNGLGRVYMARERSSGYEVKMRVIEKRMILNESVQNLLRIEVVMLIKRRNFNPNRVHGFFTDRNRIFVVNEINNDLNSDSASSSSNSTSKYSISRPPASPGNRREVRFNLANKMYKSKKYARNASISTQGSSRSSIYSSAHSIRLNESFYSNEDNFMQNCKDLRTPKDTPKVFFCIASNHSDRSLDTPSSLPFGGMNE